MKQYSNLTGSTIINIMDVWRGVTVLRNGLIACGLTVLQDNYNIEYQNACIYKNYMTFNKFMFNISSIIIFFVIECCHFCLNFFFVQILLFASQSHDGWRYFCHTVHS